MKVAFARLLADAREDLVAGRPSWPEELRSLRERKGERIAAVDEDNALLGWIGLFPGRDEGGHFYHLTGIEVLPGHRGEDLEVSLMEEAIHYAREHKTQRLKFGTSPLITGNAALYITRFGSRYRWRAGARTAGGAPWPYVTGECDIDDPLARPLDLADDEVLSRSVVDWDGRRPVPRTRVVYSGPLSMALPELDAEALAEAERADPSFLATLYSAFHALFIHGYGFAWFDRLPARLASEGDPPFYYVMNRVLGL